MAVAYVNVNGFDGAVKGAKLEDPDGTQRTQSARVVRQTKTSGTNGLSSQETVPVSSLYTPKRPQQQQSAEACRSSRHAYTSIKQFSHRVELYRGSVSTVYKATDDGSGMPVVIKAYHKKKMSEKHYHKLEREVRAMMLMRGPYVAELYSCFADDDNIYMIMEFCEGGDLFKNLLMHGGKLDEHYVCTEVIAPLLRVLEKCHALRMMHRDIKPENIFLSREGQLRLGDFGLALNFEEELAFSRSGTLDYMAPEVLKNPASQLQESRSVDMGILSTKGIRPYTTKVDIWAVGVLAYELVCGKPPFEVEDESQTASLIMYSNNLKLPITCSSQWCDFVQTALIKDPKKRPDASTLLQHPWVQQHLHKCISRAEGHHSSKEELLVALPLRPTAKKNLFQESSSSKPAGEATQAIQQTTHHGFGLHERSMSSGIDYERPSAPVSSFEATAAAAAIKGDSNHLESGRLPIGTLAKMLQQTSLNADSTAVLPQTPERMAASSSSMKQAPPTNRVPSAPVSPLDADKAAAVNAAYKLQPALSEPMGSSNSRSSSIYRVSNRAAVAGSGTTKAAAAPSMEDASANASRARPLTGVPSLGTPSKLLMQFGKRVGGEEAVPQSPGPVGPGIKARMLFHLRQQQPTKGN